MIDLDREVFIINNRILFQLSNIPRDRWTSAFNYTEDGLRFSMPLCPEASLFGEDEQGWLKDKSGDHTSFAELSKPDSLKSVETLGEPKHIQK